MCKTESDIKSKYPWLLSTKVTSPKIIDGRISRISLTEPFIHGSNLKAIIADAPEGFGKTTAILQVFEHLKRTDRACAWLTVDKNDTASSLLLYMAYALEKAGIAPPEYSFIKTSKVNEHLDLHDLGILLASIECHSKEVLLVFDDLGYLESTSCIGLINELVRYAPKNLRFGFIFHQNPGVDFSRWLLTDECMYLEVDNLRLSANQLREQLGINKNLVELKQLIALSEGWPLAVNLCVKQIEAKSVKAFSWSAMTRAGSFLCEYLHKHFTASCQPQERAFLCKIALPEIIEKSVLQEVFDTNDIEQRISSLRHFTGLITLLDAKTGSYRIHPLLKAYLRQLFYLESSDIYCHYQNKLAKAYAKRSQLLEALYHAEQACSDELKAKIIEQAGALRIWIQHGLELLRAVNSHINEHMLDAFPRLALMRCVALIKCSDLKEAECLYENTRMRTDNFKSVLKSTELNSLRFEQQFVRTMLVVYRCLPLKEEMTDTFVSIAERSQTLSPLALGLHHTLQCIVSQQKAHFDRAWCAAQSAKKEYERANSLYGKMFLNFHFGVIAMVKGNSQNAYSNYQKAINTAHKYYPKDNGLSIIGHALKFELAAECNQRNQLLENTFTLAQKIKKTEAWFDIHAAIYGTHVELLLAEHRFEEVFSFIEACDTYAHAQQLKSVSRFLILLKLLALTAAGKFEQAGKSWSQKGYCTDISKILDCNTQSWREMEMLALARMDYLSAVDDIKAWYQLSEQYLVFVRQLQLRRCEIKCLVRAVNLEERLGNTARADAYMCQLNQGVIATGYIGPVVNFYPELSGVIERGLESQLLTTSSPLVNLLDQRKTIGNNNNLTPAFSPRELEVLAGLNDGLQDKMIARKLGLSTHAVRYHLKNIYKKTLSSGRMETVKKLRLMGILT